MKATELGTQPVGRLLYQYALPAIIAMTAASLYNMIDSIFIGQGVGPLAISGLAITMPFQNLTGAFGAGIGVGASACLSVRLGQRDYTSAERVLGNSVTLNFIIGLAVGILGLLFLDPILRFFGASDHTLPYARDYMQVILSANLFSHMYFGMNAVLRAMGKPRQAMMMTIVSVILNIILAPIFIFVFNWGIRGAALATVIAQIVALIWQFRLMSDRNEILYLKRGIYNLKSRIVKDIISIGVSPFSMNACACLIVILINTALVGYGGDLAVGAYGIANRIGFLFFMVVVGINQGMQPIAGYNYGARKYERMMDVVKIAAIWATVMMTMGWAVAMFLPTQCARLFTTDGELVGLAAHGLRVINIFFPLIGAQAVITQFFQSIGRAKVSIILSLSRQLIFLLPLVIILPHFFGVDGVWYAIPASDLTASVVTIVIMALFMRRIKKIKSNETNISTI